jgi:DNA-binding transcriptional LysR family regulator
MDHRLDPRVRCDGLSRPAFVVMQGVPTVPPTPKDKQAAPGPAAPGRHVTLKQMRHFVAVIECGNISGAATLLYISQPALTRSIKELEDDLGVRLLNRHSRGAIATRAGGAFYRRAKAILADCDRANEEIRHVGAGLVGSVRLGIGALFARYIVDEAVDQLTVEVPGVEITVIEGLYEELIERLREGALDLVFSNLPEVAMPRDVVIEPLCEVEAIVVVGRQHQFARRRAVSLADLAGFKWVTVNQAHSTGFIEHLFVAQGLAVPRFIVRTNSLNLMKALILRGRFVGVMSAQFLAPELRKRLIVPLKVDVPPIRRKAGLIYRSRGFDAEPVDHMMRALRTVCAQTSRP